ncbi:restriction endonuclease subunit S [Limosilactobacillus agrestis]|uniref:restriction endonuclease subunit S n=1 Tax=Limosilactobacillus agrestis TaxID=2759748 RepID=UPI001C71FFD5
MGEVSKIVRGASPRPIKDPKWFEKDSHVGWIRISDVTEQNGRIRHLTQHLSKAGEAKTRVFEQPHLLLSIAASVGFPAINYVPIGVHDGFLIFLNSKFNINYMFYWLEKFRPLWRKYGQPGSQVNLNSDIVSNTRLALPKEAEQSKVSNFLNKVELLITLQQRKLEQLKQLKKAMLQQLFVDKNNKQPNLRFKNFNGDWEQRKLGEVIELEDNKRKPVKASKRIPGNIPYYGANGVQDYVKGYTHTGEHVLVAEDGANSIFNYPVYFICSPSWINNHSHVLTGKRSIISNKFLTYDLKTVPYAKYLVGSGRYKLNAETLKIIPIKLPLLTEQNYIGSTLSKIDTLITLQQNKLTQLTTLKKYLLQKMFI